MAVEKYRLVQRERITLGRSLGQQLGRTLALPERG